MAGFAQEGAMNHTIRCAHCRCLVLPNPRVKTQRFCSNKACQRARKAQWQRTKLATDPDKYPPAKPEVLRLLAPQRGLTAIAKSKPKTEKTTNDRLPELSNFVSPPAEPGVYHD